MNGFSVDALIRTGEAAALGRTLLHSLWEGAAVALALAIVLLVVRSSRVRYTAACAAMVAMLAGIVITFVRLIPARYALISLDPTTGQILRITTVPIALSDALPNNPGPTDYLAWLAPLWLAGVLIFQLRGLTSWMAARRLRRTGVCCAPALWQERLNRLGARLQVTRPVVLLESCLAEVPLVIGYLRPIVLMPLGLLAGLPTGQVETILLHELAHIRRYDYLVNLLQVFVEGMLFYHPGVWWISGVIRTERENCCDDLVVAATGGALEYATALTALERHRASEGPALAATGGSLVDRIQRLLGRQARGYVGAMPRVTAAILTISVVTALAALQVGPGKIVRAGTTQGSLAAKAPERVPVTQPALVVKAKAPTLLAQAAQGSPTQPTRLAEPTLLERQGPNEETLRKEVLLKEVLRKQLLTPYKKWMNEDVAYIIADEERKAFAQLNSDEERGRFVEQFWLRRDPTPGTTENEFKAEIYRRIAYTNEHFSDAAGLAGWRTDRGRIYIQYGPPDAKEARTSAGNVPFEQWMYRYIKGVGQNIVIEFVDKTGKGEYKMTMDPSEKDALLAPLPSATGR